MVDFRLESARMTAALTRILGLHNLALAEDVVQDVLCRAVELWKFHPLPDDPTAWLLRAARNRAIDLIRAERTRLRFSHDLALQSEWTLSPTVNAMFSESEIADDQLRMMFSCCPPNLPPQAQLALVLKLLCGFGTSEIAAALLASDAAVEKQISRGKRTLMRAGALYEVSGREQIGKRLESVQRALYLLFSEGYHGSHEPVRAELCREAMRLCGLLAQHPACATPRTFALLALMCFHAARLPGRATEDG
jgi:RNA polymerase sigma factor (sigma-70 family)